MANSHRNFVKWNPEIALACPKLTGPAPYVTEHASVQLLDEFLGQRITVTAERPVLGAHDVFLLGFVQLAPIGNVGGDQLTPFLGRERCGVVRFVKKIVHRLVPEQARVRLANDFIEPRLGVLLFHLLVLQQHRVLDWPPALAQK